MTGLGEKIKTLSRLLTLLSIKKSISYSQLDTNKNIFIQTLPVSVEISNLGYGESTNCKNANKE